jgi:exopolyphosphatase/guanosine-5'-triphosphate,3'-diphosphate pyrophosphatase
MSQPPFRRIAVIDLGSNSARVVVMRYTPDHSYHLEDEIREIVRLRVGMTAAGLSEEAMNRGLATLQLFKRFCQSLNVDQIIATATSAVREAANGHLFMQRVQREVGIDLRILSGEEEAFYGVLGALNAVPLTDGVVMDIGGGSAQLSQIRNRRFVQGQALTLGALALTERFVHSDPVKKSEIRNVQAEIERQLDTVSWLKRERGPLVGLGGTIRNLAKIEAARRSFPLNSINGFCVTGSGLDIIINLLREMPFAPRSRIPGLSRDRADIILPGALVVRAVMNRLGVSEISISERGLREGLFFEHFLNNLDYPVTPSLRTFSVLNLGRFYGYHETHANHVLHLASRLFDELAPLHGYGDWERELLRSAALLHDIGTSVRYNDHHKYSQMLIADNGLPGFTSREIAIIALLARFHRKGTPSTTAYASLLQANDEARVLKLSALLRLSEYLERGRTGMVRDVQAEWDKKHLRLTLISDEYPAVELWDAQRNAASVMEPAFGRSISFESQLTSTA